MNDMPERKFAAWRLGLLVAGIEQLFPRQVEKEGLVPEMQEINVAALAVAERQRHQPWLEAGNRFAEALRPVQNLNRQAIIIAEACSYSAGYIQLS